MAKQKCPTCKATGRVPIKRLTVKREPLTILYTPGKVCPTCNGKKYL